jgi:hypothetical protein
MSPKTKEAARLRQVECPKCHAQFLFRLPGRVHFDSHGFESYALACESCHVLLNGIIDPFDGALLLSTVEWQSNSPPWAT